MQRVGFIIACALISGCASQKTSNDDRRVQSLERRIKRQTALIQDLKDRNLILEKRHQIQNVKTEEASFVTSEPPADLPLSFSAAATPAPKLPTQLPAKLAPKAPQTAPPPIAITPDETGEHFLYAKILETYRLKNSAELERTLQLLVKTYPESSFTDDALYLAGLLASEDEKYPEALKSFDKLLREYPRSNKAVATLFAKASVEKRMGHSREAKRSFLQVKDLFPGSPEAARVSVELKLLESASMKRREM